MNIDKLTDKKSGLYQEANDTISSGLKTSKEASENLKEQVKETASNVYQEGKDKFNEIENVVCDYTEKFIQSIKDKPITSILIAGGIGYFLAKIFKHE
ncbi:hypothetical protein [Legionella sainthelensi]|uniref:DUF883 domain-containing protein n=1 Tax=Legionella sainthelensi TaxID=28087 RepID=A0A2H5FRY9_9GAMM|nr:hypothetical protein [Legionella sainthelensi]AUH74280.1 hypothetical protein CAB17_20305 [Legionella sainthelensi]